MHSIQFTLASVPPIVYLNLGATAGGGGLRVESGSPAQAMPRKRRVFVAFEGGGAKGIAHVGALKALERSDFEICGYSGTSAGAIVASLAAAGYTADEIVDPTAPSILLDRFQNAQGKALRAVDFFGEKGWRKVRRLRDFGRFFRLNVP